MAETNFDSLTVGGVPVTGAGAVLPNNVFWVNSTGGSDTNDGVRGRSKDSPFATIDYAIGICTASKGDVIYVMPGHAETLTNTSRITMDVTGVSVIGLGMGSLKPTLTFGTDTTADINVTAANCLLKNFRLVNNIDSLVNFLDLDADWFWGEDLDFVTSSTKEALGFINIATTKDNFFFKRLTALQPTDPAGTDGNADTGFVYIVDSENIFFDDCWFYGNFETAIFHNKTTACKNLWVRNCYGRQALSGAEPFLLVDGATGGADKGLFITPAEAAATEATLVGTLGESFFISPTCTFGNDGAAGGQGGIIVATAS